MYTSALAVRYIEKDDQGQQVNWVEPSAATRFTATASWSTAGLGPPAGCRCVSVPTAQAVIDVSWSDATASWSATCVNGCDAQNGPIRGVSVCLLYACPNAQSPTDSWGYLLMLDIDHTNGYTTACPPFAWAYTLAQVSYVASSLPNGNVVSDPPCTEGTVVSPGQQAVGATDYGQFECAMDCNSVTGPAVDVVY